MAALSGAAELIGADQGVVMFKEEDQRSLGVRAILAGQDEKSLVISQNLIRILFRGGKALFSANPGLDDRFPDFTQPPQPGDPTTLLATPIEQEGETQGFMYLVSFDPAKKFDRWSLILASLLLRPCAALSESKSLAYSRT